jgi:hypothetical protein
MAALLLRRLAGAHRGGVPLGAAAAAACGGAALFYASSSPTVVRDWQLPAIPISFSVSSIPGHCCMSGDAFFFSLGSRCRMIAGVPGEGRGSRWESWWASYILPFWIYSDLGFVDMWFDQIYTHLPMKLVQFGAWLCELKMMFAPGFCIVSNMEHKNFRWIFWGWNLQAVIEHDDCCSERWLNVLLESCHCPIVMA